MGRAMSIDKLEARAKQALGNRMFTELRKLIPHEDYNSPRALLGWLQMAASVDPRGAIRPGYLEAHSAVSELVAANDLRDKISRLYHDPKIVAEFGDKRDFWLRHPEALYEALIDSDGPGKALDTKLAYELTLVAREAADFSAEHGVAEPAIAQKPLPTSESGRAAEWKRLIAKSVTDEKLTEEESAHLKALGGHEAALEEVRRQSAMRTPPASGEFDKLISKSVSSKLTPAEEQRLQVLATDRATANGSIEAEPSPPAPDDEFSNESEGT